MTVIYFINGELATNTFACFDLVLEQTWRRPWWYGQLGTYPVALIVYYESAHA